MAGPQGICALCKTRQKLCRSHIIPEFLHQGTYDKKHRAVMLRSDSLAKLQLQKGIREYLLCAGCERLLNDNYEKPFRRMWYESPGIPLIVPDDLVEIRGLDYAAFKLFHLSILWRASVSTHHAFQQVHLGPKHDEALRTMILTGTPGNRSRYGILGALMLVPGTHTVCHSLIVGPVARRMEGHRTYIMVYAGCAWHVVVSGHRQPDILDQTLTSSGVLRLTYDEYTSYKPMRQLMQMRTVGKNQ